MDPEDLTDLISSDSEKESEDKQLRRAVQLSLQQQPDTRNDETSDELRIPDEEDEQLKLAIELSLKCQGVDESHEDQGPQNELRGAKNDPFKRESSPLKRSASGSDTHSHKRVKSLDNPDYDEAEYPTLDKEKSESPIREAGLLHRLGNPVFPGGVVKKTWAFGYPREDDIKIEEVLQSPKLKTAVLSSFQWDADWLFNKIDCKRTSVTLIMDENEAQAPMIHAKYKRIAICGPKNVIGIMHSKLMLLFYENYARIVIPTANLVPHDWGETGVMENMVFLIDLPYLSEGVAKFPAGGDRAARSMITKTGPFTKFFEGLHIFCTWMNLKPHILDQLCRCDFTATKDMAFVFGAGTVLRGNNDRSDLAYMGIPGLAYQVKELGLYSHDDLQVDFVASSVGQLVFDFVPELYLACHGTDRSRVVEWQEAHAVDSSDSEGNKNQKPPEPTTVLGLGIKSKKYSKSQIEAIVKSNLRVYFPSYETVQNSSGGPNAAGTICLTKKCWDAAMFPRELFYDCKSAREGLLMHNKVGGPLSISIVD